jgi:hypothetical protein
MENWIKYKDNVDKKIYYRFEKDVRSMSLYIESIIDAPILNLCCILGEA